MQLLNTQTNNLHGTVLITGGSRGIGKATAILLAEQGYDIIITWHSSEKRALEVVDKIRYTGRVANLLQMRLELDDLKKRFKDIDRILKKPLVGLVNNAAINGGRAFFTQKSSHDWEKIFQVNVFSLVELCKAAFKRMALSQGGVGGSIVNLSSQVANFGGNQLMAYAASKGAVNTITVALSKEVGPEGIRVNAVSPGLIGTEQKSIKFHLVGLEQFGMSEN